MLDRCCARDRSFLDDQFAACEGASRPRSRFTPEPHQQPKDHQPDFDAVLLLEERSFGKPVALTASSRRHLQSATDDTHARHAYVAGMVDPKPSHIAETSSTDIDLDDVGCDWSSPANSTTSRILELEEAHEELRRLKSNVAEELKRLQRQSVWDFERTESERSAELEKSRRKVDGLETAIIEKAAHITSLSTQLAKDVADHTAQKSLAGHDSDGFTDSIDHALHPSEYAVDIRYFGEDMDDYPHEKQSPIREDFHHTPLVDRTMSGNYADVVEIFDDMSFSTSKLSPQKLAGEEDSGYSPVIDETYYEL